jgi:signal transduction histidine kinase
MTAVAAGPRTTLQLIRHISSSSRGAESPAVLLARVCAAVYEALGFERVSAMRYHAGAEEVSEVAFAGARSADEAGRRPIASIFLLPEALATQGLVLLSNARAASSAFALPLIGCERCLGFLSGSRRGKPALEEAEVEALATVGVVLAALLESALAREEAQRLAGLKSEFIALAAHELRNPLSSIYGIYVTMDKRGDELAEPDRLALQEALREQTARMRNLIEQLLDLSRFDLAAIRVAPELIRLRPRIDELVRAQIGSRPDTVTVAVAADLEALVDPTALDRMLSNLVANALRHGEPPVTVTAARHDTHLRLAVEDCGEGVSGEFLPRLFDRFERSPESRGRTDGSGLGLAIARAYARAHGGDIVYEPAMPHGARFEVVIPLRTAETTGAGRGAVLGLRKGAHAGVPHRETA